MVVLSDEARTAVALTVAFQTSEWAKAAPEDVRTSVLRALSTKSFETTPSDAPNVIRAAFSCRYTAKDQPRPRLAIGTIQDVVTQATTPSTRLAAFARAGVATTGVTLLLLYDAKDGGTAMRPATILSIERLRVTGKPILGRCLLPVDAKAKTYTDWCSAADIDVTKAIIEYADNPVHTLLALSTIQETVPCTEALKRLNAAVQETRVSIGEGDDGDDV